MVTNEKIEEYLLNADFPYEQIADGVWIVQDPQDQIDNIVVALTPPVITFRVKLMPISEAENRAELFEQLLKFNSTMLAGAYGIESDNIVLVESLQSENLDFNEFAASVEAIALSLKEHYNLIKSFVE